MGLETPSDDSFSWRIDYASVSWPGSSGFWPHCQSIYSWDGRSISIMCSVANRISTPKPRGTSTSSGAMQLGWKSSLTLAASPIFNYRSTPSIFIPLWFTWPCSSVGRRCALYQLAKNTLPPLNFSLQPAALSLRCGSGLAHGWLRREGFQTTMLPNGAG